MFGRRNPTQTTVQSQRGDQDTEAAEEVLDSGIGLDGVAGVGGFGPYDADAPPEDRLARLDLGSLRMPVPEGAQLQIEVDSDIGCLVDEVGEGQDPFVPDAPALALTCGAAVFVCPGTFDRFEPFEPPEIESTLPEPGLSNALSEKPLKSRMRGTATLMNRSMNSYIRWRRRVTRVPIGKPSRSLKLEIAFFDFVVTAFCPTIVSRSFTTVSRSF